MSIKPGQPQATGSAVSCGEGRLSLRPSRQVVELVDLARHARQPGFDRFPKQAADGLKHLWNVERLFQQRTDPCR